MNVYILFGSIDLGCTFGAKFKWTQFVFVKIMISIHYFFLHVSYVQPYIDVMQNSQ